MHHQIGTVPGLEEAIAARAKSLAAQEGPAPLVPGWLQKVAAAAVPLFVAANASLPHPFSLYAAILGGVAALLATLPLPAFRFDKPIIPLSLVPVALSVGGYLVTFAQSLTSPWAQGACTLAGYLCFAVAGKTLPQPVSR